MFVLLFVLLLFFCCEKILFEYHTTLAIILGVPASLSVLFTLHVPFLRNVSYNILLKIFTLIYIFQKLEAMLRRYGKVISTRILRDTDHESRGVGFAR